jgi:hypothetical protein
MQPDPKRPVEQIRAIAAVVAIHAGLELAELLGPTMQGPAVRARHLAMLLAKQRLGVGPAVIARAFNRNHKSVCEGLKAVDRHLQRYPSLLSVHAAAVRSIDDGSETALLKRARRSAEITHAARKEFERKQTVDAAFATVQIGERLVTRAELARQHERFAQAMRAAGYAQLERQSA